MLNEYPETISGAFVEGFRGSIVFAVSLIVVIFTTITAFANHAHIVVAEESDNPSKQTSA